jgi:hypothetical protein
MNGGARRLQKVEANLTPTEAMALWLRKTKERSQPLSALVEFLPQGMREGRARAVSRAPLIYQM